LPDGSKVILNAKSTIQLDAGFDNKSRELSLSGEAFLMLPMIPQSLLLFTRNTLM
jgi:ferric-dicitrate binding protein FerR (iron transport regulator)